MGNWLTDWLKASAIVSELKAFNYIHRKPLSSLSDFLLKPTVHTTCLLSLYNPHDPQNSATLPRPIHHLQIQHPNPLSSLTTTPPILTYFPPLKPNPCTYLLSSFPSLHNRVTDMSINKYTYVRVQTPSHVSSSQVGIPLQYTHVYIHTELFEKSIERKELHVFCFIQNDG